MIVFCSSKGGSFANGLGIGTALGISRAAGAFAPYVILFILAVLIPIVMLIAPFYLIYRLFVPKKEPVPDEPYDYQMESIQDSEEIHNGIYCDGKPYNINISVVGR